MSLVASVYQDSSNVEPIRVPSTAVFRQPIAVREPLVTPWAQDIKGRLQELVELPSGWDGYMGAPVTFAHAVFSLSLLDRLYIDDLPMPDLIPGTDGSLQIEWHCNGCHVELDVLGANNVVATKYYDSDHEEYVLPLTNDFGSVLSWMRELL